MNKIKTTYLLAFITLSLSFSSFGSYAQNNNEDILRGKINKSSLNSSYMMGVGDRLRIITYGEPELSDEFEINSSGNISFPLIGEIKAIGLNIIQLKATLIQQLKNGYLVNPKISIELLSLRPFYIMGEVNNPGSYEYVTGMTILNAVVLAGGYTRRANEKEIEVSRQRGNKTRKLKLNESSLVMPGDTLRIKERFF